MYELIVPRRYLIGANYESINFFVTFESQYKNGFNFYHTNKKACSNRFRNRCLPVFEDDRQNAEKCEDDQQSDRLKRQRLGR